MVTRPISLLFVVISVVCFVWPFWREWRALRKASVQAAKP
jgi:TctA family transporter